MANGVSCAYFAAKNFNTGVKNKDIFRDGIGCIQTVRTADVLVKHSNAPISVAKQTSKLAQIGKKIIYPLIVLSGIFNTLRSKDKVKTACEQTAAISVMYAFETIADKILKNMEKTLLEIPVIKNNKFAKAGVYLAKGIGFICASMSGYTIGKESASLTVDTIRAKKQEKINKKYQEENKEFLDSLASTNLLKPEYNNATTTKE